MRNVELALEETGTSESLCLASAVALHILVFIWNPILLKSDFVATHDFVTVDVVEQPGSSLLPPAPPQKMSLMSTLKDMLLKPKMEEIAHVAPSMPQAQAPATPEQPALKERAFQPMTPHFLPTHTDNDQIAAMSSPSAIQTPGAKMPTLPVGEATLKTKSFGGIRAQDVPFQVSSQESLAANSVSAIPIAVGNQSAKSALGYSAPALQESGHHTLTTRTPIGGGAGADAVALNAGQGPAPIALSGAGSNGNAPVGSPGNGGSLQQRSGGGLVGRSLFGSGGSGSANVLGAMPSAAQELDTQIAQAMTAGSKASGPVSHKGFEIAGPLTKRPIVNKVIPQYPAWAEEQGIIGSVRLYFTVTPEGAVRSYIRVTKTTGYQQLDQLAIDALKQWQFAPLSQTDDEGKGEWGIITFNFSLSS